MAGCESPAEAGLSAFINNEIVIQKDHDKVATVSPTCHSLTVNGKAPNTEGLQNEQKI